MNTFKNWDEVLAWVIAKQKEHEAAGGVDYGALSLALLNKATLAEKAKMTPEAIAAEEEARRNYKFN
jgi:hypothetical protein